MRILVVDDHPLVRKGVAEILRINGETEPVEEASSPREAEAILNDKEVDIALVDINLGKENGLHFVEKTIKKFPNTKYIMLTSSSKSEDFNRAKQLNVSGYILKDAFIEDIISALHTVGRGNKFYSHQLLEEVGKKDSIQEKLTDREKEIFEYARKGLCNQDIADTLCIAEGTVKKHISNILGKLQLTNRVELVVYGRQE